MKLFTEKSIDMEISIIIRCHHIFFDENDLKIIIERIEKQSNIKMSSIDYKEYQQSDCLIFLVNSEKRINKEKLYKIILKTLNDYFLECYSLR